MVPIHELLARIRWDPEFGRARFVIAYVDHEKEALVRVPFERIALPADHRFGFEALEEDGTRHSVPYHRVREVWRDGERIWSRRG
ncbi:MAG: DUF504 domain-containing protein [Betaproteobacteria bacterium]|nr:DUF504 domain-containing protein [Betaproteobacteria bacterium]MDH5221862.1 DUF504 domain-containing protein [Betaproteobacteria bacterium]MDH5350972.1 DUF504 domain-containing protein [Betaproteobacteria bacterium]